MENMLISHKVEHNFLEKTYNTLIETNTNICCSRMAFHSNIPIIRNIPLKNRKRGEEYDTFEEKSIVPIINVVTNGKLYRRDYIDITHGSFSANEDLSLNYYLYAKARYISFANGVLYHYIPSANGLVHNNISGYTFDKMKNTFDPLIELKRNFEDGGLFDEFRSEVEQIFIKNIFQRVDYINKHLVDSEEKTLLINTLYDFITFNFPNWQENSYFLFYFKDFELPDMLSCFKNKPMINNYKPYEYTSLDDVYHKYKDITGKILTKKL